jgi:hypothetical protein
MTREDWDNRDKKRDFDILLQVAFKASVELIASGKFEYKPQPNVPPVEIIENLTLSFHKWLLSQTKAQSPVTSQKYAPQSPVDVVNQAIAQAQADEGYPQQHEVTGDGIDF